MSSLLIDDTNYTWGEQSESSDPIDQIEPIPISPFPISTNSQNVMRYANMFDRDECKKWIEAAEAIGFQDASVITDIGMKVLEHSKETGIPVIWPAPPRNNQRLIWQVREETAGILFDKLYHYLPKTVLDVFGKNWNLSSINRRWRFFKTSESQDFKSHYDAACARGDGARSFLSVVINLNSNFKGGELFEDATGETFPAITGSATLFWHDGHVRNVKHTALPVTSGIKYIIRTDVFFLPG